MTEEDEQVELIEEQYEENALASAIGITRRRLEDVRLKKAAPWAYPSSLWAYVKGGRVGYTKKGVGLLFKELGVELQKKAAKDDLYGRKNLREVLDASRLGEPKEGMEGCYRAMTILRCRQPRMLMAAILDHEELPYGFHVRVLVKNNAHFVNGMEMAIRPKDAAQYLFVHVGALPRSRGRW